MWTVRVKVHRPADGDNITMNLNAFFWFPDTQTPVKLAPSPRPSLTRPTRPTMVSATVTCRRPETLPPPIVRPWPSPNTITSVTNPVQARKAPYASFLRKDLRRRSRGIKRSTGSLIVVPLILCSIFTQPQIPYIHSIFIISVPSPCLLKKSLNLFELVYSTFSYGHCYYPLSFLLSFIIIIKPFQREVIFYIRLGGLDCN